MTERAEKADKREQILIAAEELFSERGFDGTSVRDIAQHANVNLAMISYYFGSKEKLLEALIEMRATYTYNALEEISKHPSMTPWEKIDRMLDMYVDRIIANRRFHSIISNEYNTGRSKEVKDMITNIKLRSFEVVKRIIAEGQRQELFRNVDVELTMGSIMGTITQLVNSRKLFCTLLHIDDADEYEFRVKVKQRLSAHLKQLMRAHLDIRNETSH